MNYTQIELSTDDLVLIRMSLSDTAKKYASLSDEQKNITNLKQHVLSEDIIKRIDKKLSEIPADEERDSEISLMEGI